VSTLNRCEWSKFDCSVMSLRASVCITYNLFTVASVAVVSASQPHYREGFIYALHVPISTDL